MSSLGYICPVLIEHNLNPFIFQNQLRGKQNVVPENNQDSRSGHQEPQESQEQQHVHTLVQTPQKSVEDLQHGILGGTSVASSPLGDNEGKEHGTPGDITIFTNQASIP